VGCPSWVDTSPIRDPSPAACNLRDRVSFSDWVCAVSRLGRDAIIALLCTPLVCFATEAGATSEQRPVIAPEVRQLVRASSARVIVELRLDASLDPNQRAEAIARAQDSLLSRLPPSHASVARRYTSVPLLALEIDVTALAALEAMTDIVVSVKPDRQSKTQ
jgi:hypothetical protein